MADQEKTGTPWRDDELDAIVADYFAMRESELSGQPYVKAHHNASLVEQIGRSRGSVEFKYQNISAVLEELAMEIIPGFKPRRNYQAAIFPAIDRYISQHEETLLGMAEPRQEWIPEVSLFVDTPESTDARARPPGLESLVRKFDPVERDRRNRQLGRAGEALVLNVERDLLVKADRRDLAGKVRWIADEDGDGAGFDVLSFSPSGEERLIEVKTTNGPARTPFFLSRNERET
ncbi:MAG: DUF3883 domain-containing protein, partial [Bauldia litoralis]